MYIYTSKNEGYAKVYVREGERGRERESLK